ncbi:MAG TPA: LUD domain-containing protein, partial [Acidimicrobiia bacterium]|nr:LUD domain-containing protein [Acidimicrobiia bacterium]
MIDTLIEGLRANACTVVGPVPAGEACAVVVERVPEGALVACNDDVGLPGLADSLRARGCDVLLPGAPVWSSRLADAAAGITGAALAVAAPATLALVAAPGSPRATSLVPPAHVCVV